MRLLLLMIAACGSPIVAPRILPPNVEQACDRAIACKVFLDEQKPECVNCVETVAAKWNAEANAAFDGHPPSLALILCADVTQLAHDTNLSACVVGRWFGP